MASTHTTALLKGIMLNALRKTCGIVTAALDNIENDEKTDYYIGRRTYYEWLEKDPDFKRSVEEMESVAIDFAESCLMTQMKDGSSPSTTFFLKTRGKKRGYVEKQEIEHSGTIQAPMIMPNNGRNPDENGVDLEAVVKQQAQELQELREKLG